jgi:LacI family transcriptional regulator
MKTTIDDIAKEAGVSKATVSRVLNDRIEGVGEETRSRVKAIIESLGFEPCGVARGLATGKSRSVGLVIPDIADPFFSLLIRGIEDVLRGPSYGLFLCDSDLDISREKDHLRMLLEKRVDGVILNSTDSDCGPQLDLLERRNVPCILLDRMIEARSTAAGVYADNRKGARIAAEFLLKGGARRLLFISGPAELSVSKLRKAGFEDAYREGGDGLSPVRYAIGDHSVESGERLVDAILEEAGGRTPEGMLPFDAIFAANDRMAIGAMRSLAKRGIRVPEEVEVVGFDDIEHARLVDPPLTTVAQPAFEMGRESALLLLRMIDGKKPRKRTVLMDPTLVVRGTTRPR